MFRFFRRLQWKLALSYALVTAGTVIVLAALLVLAAIYLETHTADNLNSSYFWTKTGFQDNIPFLLDDPKALQAWLERVQSEGFTRSDFTSYTVRETMSHAKTLITGEPIFVLDPELNILAAAPLKDPSIIGKPYEEVAPKGYEITTIVYAVLGGDKNYVGQSLVRSDGSYLAAFPLRKSDADPVSAIVVYQAKPYPSVVPANLAIYGVFFTVTTIAMFVISLPVGAVFGWLASRGLRKRLNNLSAASQAWSQGDFTVSPRDPSGDEIGALTRTLNGMAEQLQTLIQTHDELARVEERNRLARDLHDTVKQQTYAARMQLTAAKNLLGSDLTAAAGHLDTALQLNRETQQELKLIIDELRPAALQGKGLAYALMEYADRWQEHTGIKVETSVSGERSLPLEVEQALYRVLQEALSNIVRHAQADRVRISLSMSPEQVRLTVADNGRGFDVNTIPPNSYGLAGMQARLSEVGGALQIESRPSEGTTITADVELNTKDTMVTKV
jgi:signal transduction histidine kinase